MPRPVQIVGGPRDGELVPYQGRSFDEVEATVPARPAWWVTTPWREPWSSFPVTFRTVRYDLYLRHDGNGHIVERYIPADLADGLTGH